MAKNKQPSPTANLVSPKGTRVTVHADKVAAFKARGYTAPGNTRGRKPAEKTADQADE